MDGDALMEANMRLDCLPSAGSGVPVTITVDDLLPSSCSWRSTAVGKTATEYSNIKQYLTIGTL